MTRNSWQVWLFLLLGLALPVSADAQESSDFFPNAGEFAQYVKGEDLGTGKYVDLKDYKGKWVYLEFWATTCGPCIRMLPDLLADTAEYRASGELQIVFVTPEPESSRKTVKDFIAKNGLDFPVLFHGDAPGSPSEKWRVLGNPVAFLIDPTGRITAKACGAEHCPKLIELFEAYRNESVTARPLLRSKFVAGAVPGKGELVVAVGNLSGDPLYLEMDYRLLEISFDAAGNITNVQRIEQRRGLSEWSKLVSFEGKTTQVLRIPVDLGKYQALEYTFSLRLDDTVAAPRGEGLWTYQGGEVMLVGDMYYRERNEIIIDRVP